METKPKGLFDHVNHLYETQSLTYFDSLTDSEKRNYSVYMVNRILSMNIHQLPFVNEIQQYSITPETHYTFFRNILPKRRQYNKYIKGAKNEKYEEWLVLLVTKHFQVSEKEAIDYLEIYYTHDKPALRQLCLKYGTDEKMLKKVKI